MRQLLLFMVSLFWLGSAGPSAVAASYEVNFPADKSLGRLIIDTSVHEKGKVALKPVYVQARGRVMIPSDSLIHIVLTYEGLEHFAAFKQLHPQQIVELQTNKQEFEDSHLAQCASWTNLQKLLLNDSLITDKSMPIIARFTRLKELKIGKTDIHGSNFELLKNLTCLQNLNIQGTALVPGALAKLLPVFPSLIWLDLAKTSLADDDLAVVVKAANITSLSLIGNPRVTNRGMKTLASLKNLQQLYLTDTSVTDTALADLRRMPGLRQLTVRAAKFWQGGKSPIGALKFEIIDATRTYQVPTELFSPLH